MVQYSPHIDGVFQSETSELPEIATQIPENTSQKCQWIDFFDINNTSGSAEVAILFKRRRTLVWYISANGLPSNLKCILFSLQTWLNLALDLASSKSLRRPSSRVKTFLAFEKTKVYQLFSS